LPGPSVVGIGLTEKSLGSVAGVSGKVPGRPEDTSLLPSFGTWPANAAVVDIGATPDMICEAG
jgi:hypothetical protein